MTVPKLVRRIIELADKMAEAQLAWANRAMPDNAENLRKATEAYLEARSAVGFGTGEMALAVTRDEVSEVVLSRISGLDLHRPVSTQEVGLVMTAISYTYEEVARDLIG